MDDRKAFARAQAEAFNARTLQSIGHVLESHSRTVVEYALEMQARLDAAEALLAEIAACKVIRTSEKERFQTIKVRAEIMDRVDALVAASRTRTQ